MKRINLIVLCLVIVSLVTVQTAFAAKNTSIDPNSYPGATEKELGQLKWVLMLANEPIDDFKDIHAIDQVGVTADRYTIAFSAYFLAAEQYYKMPAWNDGIKVGIDRLIQKMEQKPVWEYWSHDSAGVPKYEPLMNTPYAPFSDPIAYRNIMYSGHLSQMINLYQMLYNERKFDEPGSIILKWDDRTQFVYDNQKLQDAMFMQLIRINPVPGIECEPNAIFPACNTHPHLGWKLYDQAHGTRYFDAANPLFLKFFKDRFVDYETGELGAFYLVKQGWVFSASNPSYGNKLDAEIQKMVKEGISFGSSGNEGWIMTGFHVFDPAFVEKLYPDFKKLHVKMTKDGLCTLQKDVLTPFSYYGFFSILAAEMGDKEVLDGLLKVADEHFGPVWEDGTYHYPCREVSDFSFVSADKKSSGKDQAATGQQKQKVNPQMQTWPMHSDLSDRLFGFARALPKNGLLYMYNHPFDQTHFGEPGITDLDLSETLLKRAIYDREKAALVVSTMAGKQGERARFRVVRLNPNKTYEIYVDGSPLQEISERNEYKVDLDGSKAHDVIIVEGSSGESA